MNNIILEPLLYYKYNTCELNNLNFIYKDCKHEKDVLFYDKEYDGCLNAYYRIMKLGDKYKMYYRAGNSDDLNMSHENAREYQLLCIGESDDGVNFIKSSLNLYNYNNNNSNNIIMKNNFCHNFFPYFDPNTKSLIAITGTKFDVDGIWLFNSIDSYNWEQKHKLLDTEHLIPDYTHPNHFDSFNIILFNNKDNLYYIYLRNNNKQYRKVQYTTSTDLKNFSKCQEVFVSNFNNDIYASGITLYPNTNYLIGLSTTNNQSNFYKYGILIISEDGINFEMIKDNIFNLDYSNFCVYDIVKSNDENKFYLYCHNVNNLKDGYVSCYSYEINRIGCLYTDNLGSFNTKNINLINTNIYINFNTNLNGYIKVELYNCENNLIDYSNIITGNYYNYKIDWINKIEIVKNKYYLKYIILNSEIYSYSYEK